MDFVIVSMLRPRRSMQAVEDDVDQALGRRSAAAGTRRPLDQVMLGRKMPADGAGADAGSAGHLGGQYFGPGGFGHIRGYPTTATSNRRSHDVQVQKRLWAVSKELTGVVYPVS
jgi:hypothetical protein